MARTFRSPLALSLGTLLATSAATAQKAPAPAQPAPPVNVTVTPPASPQQPAYDPNGGLPSSSRAYQPGKSDGFDLGRGSGGGSTLRGSNNSPGVFNGGAVRVPATHVVRRGDTLFDITGHYYRNPWMWPKIWSYNPAIQNPHWIYPGDQIKLRNDGGDDQAGGTLGSGIINRRPVVPPNTVFLRDQGYIDDPRRDVWGQISGAPEDKMLLGDGDHVYLEVSKDHTPKKDQELTIFRPLRSAGKGSVVQILGTVRIEMWDEDKRIARAKIVESLDVIERGASIGPVGRRFDVVPPTKNKGDLAARVVVSVQPRVYYGQNQVVFLDKGSDDGLVAGNRLFILRRGDPWRRGLSGAGDLSDKSVKNNANPGNEIEDVRGTDRDGDYPDEIVGELRVLRVREKTATCLVTNSKVELVSGDLAVARKGY